MGGRLTRLCRPLLVAALVLLGSFLLVTTTWAQGPVGQEERYGAPVPPPQTQPTPTPTVVINTRPISPPAGAGQQPAQQNGGGFIGTLKSMFEGARDILFAPKETRASTTVDVLSRFVGGGDEGLDGLVKNFRDSIFFMPSFPENAVWEIFAELMVKVLFWAWALAPLIYFILRTFRREYQSLPSFLLGWSFLTVVLAANRLIWETFSTVFKVLTMPFGGEQLGTNLKLKMLVDKIYLFLDQYPVMIPVALFAAFIASIPLFFAAIKYVAAWLRIFVVYVFSPLSAIGLVFGRVNEGLSLYVEGLVRMMELAATWIVIQLVISVLATLPKEMIWWAIIPAALIINTTPEWLSSRLLSAVIFPFVNRNGRGGNEGGNDSGSWGGGNRSDTRSWGSQQETSKKASENTATETVKSEALTLGSLAAFGGMNALQRIQLDRAQAQTTAAAAPTTSTEPRTGQFSNGQTYTLQNGQFVSSSGGETPASAAAGPTGNLTDPSTISAPAAQTAAPASAAADNSQGSLWKLIAAGAFEHALLSSRLRGLRAARNVLQAAGISIGAAEVGQMVSTGTAAAATGLANASLPAVLAVAAPAAAAAALAGVAYVGGKAVLGTATGEWDRHRSTVPVLINGLRDTLSERDARERAARRSAGVVFNFDPEEA